MSVRCTLLMALMWFFPGSCLAAGTGNLPPCLAAALQDETAPFETVIVDRVIDGDTMITDRGIQIRLANIRAPKHTATRTQLRAAPYSKIATTALSTLAVGKQISLMPDHTQDRYGRVRAHVILHTDRDGDFWLQEHLVRQGLVRVDITRHLPACGQPLLAAEEDARRNQKGLWASSFYRLRQHDDLAGLTGSFQLVEGTVLDVAHRRNRYFLNFGADWRSDFTITISPKYARSFSKDLDPMTLKGQKVRVRGWVESYNGPFIEAVHPNQIEILDQNTNIAPF